MQKKFRRPSKRRERAVARSSPFCTALAVIQHQRRTTSTHLHDMIERFELVTGLSDQTLDNTTAIASVVMGASIIEKHFTLDRNSGGPDHSFSLEPAELAVLCRDSKTAWDALGKFDYGRKSSEQGNIKLRRLLYFVTDMKAGEFITEDCIRSVRPGFGLPPKFTDKVIGRSVNADVQKNPSVGWC